MFTPHMRKGLLLAVGLGCGIGLMAGGVLWSIGAEPRLTDAQIEARARVLNMVKATELPPAPAKVTVVVQPDTSLADLAGMLKVAGLTADADAFLAAVKAKHPEGKPKPGIHLLSAGEAQDRLIDELVAAQ